MDLGIFYSAKIKGRRLLPQNIVRQRGPNVTHKDHENFRSWARFSKLRQSVPIHLHVSRFSYKSPVCWWVNSSSFARPKMNIVKNLVVSAEFASLQKQLSKGNDHAINEIIVHSSSAIPESPTFRIFVHLTESSANSKLSSIRGHF